MASTKRQPAFSSTLTSSTPSRLVAIGASAGGLNAFSTILAALPENFPAPIVIVQHLSADFPSRLAYLLGDVTRLPVKEAQQDDRLRAGRVYVAPPGKHLVINSNLSLSLSLAPKVHHCRPSADVLFRSAAASCAAGTIGVVLTGGDGDGADGIQAIKAAGGITIAQDLPSSQQPSMPLNAAATGSVDYVLPLPEIAAALVTLVQPGRVRLNEDYADLKFENTALRRVQAAWRSAGHFAGDGAGPQEINRLVTKALEEVDGCMEALVMAEAALVAQNLALAEFQDFLRDERQGYKTLLSIVSDGIIATDSVGIVRAVSPAAARMLGRSGRHMIGRPFAKIARRGEGAVFERAISRALMAGGSQQGLGLGVRGGLPSVCATAFPTTNKQGIPIGLLWRLRLEDTIS